MVLRVLRCCDSLLDAMVCQFENLQPEEHHPRSGPERPVQNRPHLPRVYCMTTPSRRQFLPRLDVVREHWGAMWLCLLSLPVII